jgi:hypothetical protein
MKKWIISLVLILNTYLFPTTAEAHAFGKLYNLPVPFWMYLYAAASAMLISFLVIGYFLNTRKSFTYPALTIGKVSFSSNLVKVFQIISVILFLLTITSGLIGENSSYTNFNMTFFWIYFVLGLTYLIALTGNIYSVLNPWKILVEWFEKFTNITLKERTGYPKSLGYYPALLFYFLFIFTELFIRPGPYSLSLILIQYTVLNFIGVILIGKEKWFKYCEFFSIFFNLIGKISPFEKSGGKLKIRPPFVGLLKEKADHFSLLLFILFMLSSTAFDGFKITIVWYANYWAKLAGTLNSILGTGAYDTFQKVNLFISPFVFLLIYFVLIYFAKIITRSKLSVNNLMLSFALSLLPIAFVYHAAHYYNLILSSGQDMIRIISDPFGFGWNLFGTASYVTDLSIIDAGVTWHVQVALILTGHIAAVFLAHIKALEIFPTHKKALLSQLPMLILMVAFTAIGLWILAQPITGGDY